MQKQTLVEHANIEARKPFYRVLYVQVLIGVMLGVLAGHFWPELGAALKPLGDGFVLARELGQNGTLEVEAGAKIGGAAALQEDNVWISTTQSAA